MKLPRNLGMTLLAIYLIVIGIVQIANISLGSLSILLPILAVVTGIVLLMGK